MKKGHFLLLGLCVGFVGVALCGCAPQQMEARNILIKDAKTEFHIGDDFSFSENMQIELEFTNGQIMNLETPSNYDFSHNPANKMYYGLHYTIDYGAFDSSVYGRYPIYVYYDHHDDNPDNDRRSFFMVNVLAEENTWVSMPSITNFVYGEKPTITAPVAEYNNEGLNYSFRQKGVGEFRNLGNNAAEAENLLAAADAGNYELNVSFTGSLVYAPLQTTLEFTIDRAPLPAHIESAIHLDSKPYTGYMVYPDVLGYPGMYYLDHTASYRWVEVGVYDVPLSINLNYKWSDTDDAVKYFKFEIVPATNTWFSEEFLMNSKVGGVDGFKKGQFSDQTLTLPVAHFGEVTLAIKLKGQDDSYFADVSLNDIASLDPAQYVLKAYIKESPNYVNMEALTIEFEVFAQD